MQWRRNVRIMHWQKYTQPLSTHHTGVRDSVCKVNICSIAGYIHHRQRYVKRMKIVENCLLEMIRPWRTQMHHARFLYLLMVLPLQCRMHRVQFCRHAREAHFQWSEQFHDGQAEAVIRHVNNTQCWDHYSKMCMLSFYCQPSGQHPNASI